MTKLKSSFIKKLRKLTKTKPKRSLQKRRIDAKRANHSRMV